MGNKKNIFIGLSTLLLVLLLGSFTRSFAISSDDILDAIDEINIKAGTTYSSQLFLTSQNERFTNVMTWIDDHDYSMYNRFSFQEISNYGYGYIYMWYEGLDSYYWRPDNINEDNNTINIDTATDVCKITMRYNKQTSGTYKGYYIDTIVTTSQKKVTNGGNNASNTTLLNISKPIYITDGGSEIWSFPILDFYNFPVIPPGPTIQFIPYPNKVADVYVGQNYNFTAYGCTKNNTYVSMRFGDLIQPPGFEITEIDVSMSYYNRGQNKWIEKFLLLRTGSDLQPDYYKSSIANFKWENYDGSTYTHTFSAFINNNYVHENCMYHFVFIGNYGAEPFYIEQSFYIIDNNTVITDGNLDISFLQTGDYANSYANDLNDLAKQISAQNDLIDAVEQGNINSWIPGSGDWSSLIGLVGSGEDIVNTANLWGFRNYSNSYWAGLYEMMNATYTVLSQTGTVALDVSFHGYNHVITSADIPAPPSTIRNTIALCLTTFVMISIYKSFSKKIEKLKMVDTSVLKSEAHDDSDLM